MNKALFKRILTQLGPLISPQWVHNVNGILNYLSIGWWMHREGFGNCKRHDDRGQLYSAIAREIESVPVSYLEFGVYRGDSIRTWSSLLQHPQTRLYGFDSFEGLPESWVLSCAKGAFDVGGELPRIGDDRVAFIKGWFSDTLPTFLQSFTPESQLVVHLDADLYSSTIFVLEQLKPFIRTGTILIFDELFDRNHELKALQEFLDSTRVTLECLGATDAFQQVAFRIAKSAQVTT